MNSYFDYHLYSYVTNADTHSVVRRKSAQLRINCDCPPPHARVNTSKRKVPLNTTAYNFYLTENRCLKSKFCTRNVHSRCLSKLQNIMTLVKNPCENRISRHLRIDAKKVSMKVKFNPKPNLIFRTRNTGHCNVNLTTTDHFIKVDMPYT